MAGYIGNIPVPSFIDVYQNGVKLVDGDDYTATDGNTVVLASGVN